MQRGPTTPWLRNAFQVCYGILHKGVTPPFPEVENLAGHIRSGTPASWATEGIYTGGRDSPPAQCGRDEIFASNWRISCDSEWRFFSFMNTYSK